MFHLTTEEMQAAAFDSRCRTREHFIKRHTENLLNADERRWLFMELWRNTKGLCTVCGSEEGKCVNGSCIRTRVTNKLGLSRWENA